MRKKRIYKGWTYAEKRLNFTLFNGMTKADNYAHNIHRKPTKA